MPAASCPCIWRSGTDARPVRTLAESPLLRAMRSVCELAVSVLAPYAIPAPQPEGHRMPHSAHVRKEGAARAWTAVACSLPWRLMTLPYRTAHRSSLRRARYRRSAVGLLACVVSAGTGALTAGATASAAGSPAVQAWQATQAPMPSTAAANPLVEVRQITCAARGECVGVASFNNAAGVATGVIEHLHAGTWTATSAPTPPRIAMPQRVTLTSVSCPTPVTCGVSGYLSTPATRRSELLTLSRGTWTAHAAPLLPGTLADSQTLSAISCPRPGRCVAVGRYQGGAHGYFQGLIEVQSGSAWHAVEAPLPEDTTRTADPFGGVAWISCPAAGRCMTVGAYVDNQGRRELFADVLSRGRWHSSRLPLPSRAAANPLAYLGYVACHGLAHCVAGGNLTVSGGAQDGLFEREDRGRWHASAAPLPAGAAASPDATINEVSCPAARFCAAAGNYNDSIGAARGVLETFSAGKWHATTAAAPADDRTSRFMTSVSCPVANWCVAAGSTNFTGLLETLARGHWTLTAAPLPAPGTGAVFQGTSVSCPSPRMCAAFGSYELHGPPQTGQGLLESYSG
jgi:hypothetical protein